MKKLLATISTVLLSAAMLAGNVMTAAAYEGQNSDIVATTAEQSNAKSTITRTGISAQLKELLKKNFDAEYYARMNPDVRAAYGDNEEALFNHFLAFGIWEGRQINTDFNVNAYASAYDDLQTAYSEQSAAQQIVSYYQHYFNYVVTGKENRNLTTIDKAAAAGVTVKSFSADADYHGTVLSYVVEQKVAGHSLEAMLVNYLKEYVASVERIVEKYCSESMRDTLLLSKPEDDLDGEIMWANQTCEALEVYEPEYYTGEELAAELQDTGIDKISENFMKEAYSQNLSLTEYMMSFDEFKSALEAIDEYAKSYDGPIFDEDEYKAKYEEWLNNKPAESASEKVKMMYCLTKPSIYSCYREEFQNAAYESINYESYFGPYTMEILMKS